MGSAERASPGLHSQMRQYGGQFSTPNDTDENASDQGRRKVDAINEPVEWYFTLSAETTRQGARRHRHPSKVGTIAMPLLSFYPLEKEGTPLPPPTHFEVLLPQGRTGWCRPRPCAPSRRLTSATRAPRPASGSTRRCVPHARLEARVGVRLFDRTPRSMTLAQESRRFYVRLHCRCIFATALDSFGLAFRTQPIRNRASSVASAP
jgi:hypothetical protein